MATWRSFGGSEPAGPVIRCWDVQAFPVNHPFFLGLESDNSMNFQTAVWKCRDATKKVHLKLWLVFIFPIRMPFLGVHPRSRVFFFEGFSFQHLNLKHEFTKEHYLLSAAYWQIKSFFINPKFTVCSGQLTPTSCRIHLLHLTFSLVIHASRSRVCISLMAKASFWWLDPQQTWQFSQFF